jgi:hypothetical protein
MTTLVTTLNNLPLEFEAIKNAGYTADQIYRTNREEIINKLKAQLGVRVIVRMVSSNFTVIQVAEEV